MDYKKFNRWLDENINPVRVKAQDVCEASHRVDGMLQKVYVKNLEYTVYPERTQETFETGLRVVIEMLDKLYRAQETMSEVYNQRLYEYAKRIDALEAERGCNKTKQCVDILQEAVYKLQHSEDA